MDITSLLAVACAGMTVGSLLKLYAAGKSHGISILSYLTAVFLLWVGESGTLKFMADDSAPYLGGLRTGLCLMSLNLVSALFAIIPSFSLKARVVGTCIAAWCGILLLYLFAPEVGEWKHVAHASDKLIVGMSLFLPAIGMFAYFKALDAVDGRKNAEGALPTTFACPLCQKSFTGPRRLQNTTISCPACKKPIKCSAARQASV